MNPPNAITNRLFVWVCDWFEAVISWFTGIAPFIIPSTHNNICLWLGNVMGIIDADHKQHVKGEWPAHTSTHSQTRSRMTGLHWYFCCFIQQSAGNMSICQGDLTAMDTGISTLTGVSVTLFSVVFTVMSTPVSERLNTPLSPPTTVYEASDVRVYSCHSLGLEYTQLCFDWLVEKHELLSLMPC